MKESARNALVGLTAIAGLVILGYLVIIFGQVPQWVTPSYPLAVHLDDASGIASGTRVRLNGIDVGFVESVELKTPSYLGVIVRCEIHEGRRIPANATALATAGLLGGAAQLNIRAERPPSGEEESFLATDGSAEMQGKMSDLGGQITEVATRLESTLSVQLEKFGRMADEFTAAAREVRTLLEPQDLAAVESGDSQGNLRTLIAHADQRIMDMRETIDNFNALLDEQMREEVKGAVADVRGLTRDAREKLSVLSDRVVNLSDELSTTLATTNALLSEARQGRGTLGRLVQDPQLYNALTDTAHRMTDTLNEIKLLIQKWKAEGLPVQF